uniref:eIF-4F 25 kDa subunit n=1 Tax=Wollemia nobilis TaxID=56998 RepID=A0A0C9S883_9CONI
MGEAAEIGDPSLIEREVEEGEIVEREGEGEGEVDGEGIERPLAKSSHPLEHSWTFWFDNPQGKSKQTAWGSSLRPVYTFGTVEDFWCLYNNILQPSRLVPGSDFHCFKDGIEPKWEDPKCANGGKWTVSNTRGKPIIDTLWLHTVLAMIGEQFDEGDDICGAVVSVRARQEKLALWTKNAADEDAQMSIGIQWKEFLDYNEKIGYVFHDDAKKMDKMAKNRYNL